MGSFLLGARLVLVAVLATAAAGKFLDRPGSRRALEDFGVPGRAAAIGAVALPVAELATAVALVPAPSARFAAGAAAALMLAFIAGIARALARGQTPDCHCFGQIHSAPAGRATLARNAVLAGLAGAIVVEGSGPSVGAWLSARSAAELVAVGNGIAAVVLAGAATRLWSERRALRRDLDRARDATAGLPPGLPSGATAPEFSLPSLSGETISLASLRARGRPVMLVFMDADCGSCQPLFPEVGHWQARLGEQLTVAVVSSRAAKRNRAPFEQHGITPVLLQKGSEVMEDYRVKGTPTAVVVTPEGRIASGAAEGVFMMEPLVRLTLRRWGETAAVSPAGEQQPAA